MLLPYLWTGVERWMLKSDRLVCEKNTTIAQPVTNYNLDPSILIVTNLPIVRGKICNTSEVRQYQPVIFFHHNPPEAHISIHMSDIKNNVKYFLLVKRPCLRGIISSYNRRFWIWFLPTRQNFYLYAIIDITAELLIETMMAIVYKWPKMPTGLSNAQNISGNRDITHLIPIIEYILWNRRKSWSSTFLSSSPQ